MVGVGGLKRGLTTRASAEPQYRGLYNAVVYEVKTGRVVGNELVRGSVTGCNLGLNPPGESGDFLMCELSG